MTPDERLDLGFLPDAVREGARVTTGAQAVMWRLEEADAALDALAAAGRVILGLDLRREDTSGVTEVAWSSFVPGTDDPVAESLAVAKAALGRDRSDVRHFTWVLVTWSPR